MPSLKRTAYHTHIKYLAYHDLLSPNILHEIPRSNLARWKKEYPGRYQSFELNLQACRDYELIHHFAHSPSAKQVYAAYVRILKTALSIAHALPGFHRAVESQARHVVSLFERVKKSTGLKRALRIFNISVPTFRTWSAQTMTQCFQSFTGKCNLLPNYNIIIIVIPWIMFPFTVHKTPPVIFSGLVDYFKGGRILRPPHG